MPPDSTTIHRLDRPEPMRVARAATLEGFVDETTGAAGVLLCDLPPLTTLIVQTRNTRYRIIVTGGGVVVQGGSFFQDPTPAHLDGATLGGSFLKLGWIGVGLRMEIRAGGRRIVTTPVRCIGREERRDAARPH